MRRYIIPFEECSQEYLDFIGGKNANLGVLTSIGISVPPGFAITIEGYKEVVRFNNLEKKIEVIINKVDPSNNEATLRASKQMRELFRGALVPDAVKNEIKESYETLEKKCEIKNLPVAVRSSAVEEDAPDASFAGQHETYLWVRGVDNVFTKVMECFASLFTQRAVAYRAVRGFKLADAAISVGVQKMVKPRSAGVMFTLNPITGDRSRVSIESVWGIGETLVGGEVDPDGFRIDKIFFTIKERKTGTKLIERVVDEVEGTRKLEVEESRQTQPSLSDEEAIYLAKLGQKIEQHYKKPQDIEFAVEKDAAFPGNIFIVQARPETVWSRKKKEATKLSPMEYIARELEKGIRL